MLRTQEQKERTTKIKEIGKIIKEAYNEYRERLGDISNKARIYGFETYDYFEAILGKKLEEKFGEIEVRLLSEGRGFIWEKSNLYEFSVIPTMNSVTVIIDKYYLKETITL